MKRWQIFLILIIVAFLPYSAALVKGQQLGPTEHIQTMITPGAPKPDYGWDILQADGDLQFLPWRDLVFDSWKKGEAPILNPYQLAGQPLAANSQSGGFYPPHMIFAFLPGSTGLKIILLGILHLLVAGTGFFYLLRNLKVSESGALLGATAFALSQFMVAWAPLASVPSTVAWIPWILAGILCADKRLGFLQVSFATAMMLLAGHLQFAFYGMFAAFLVWAWTMFARRKVAALVPLLALLLGLVVALPQVGLVLKNSSTSHRKNVPTFEGYDGYRKGVLAPYEALSLVNPKLLGDPSVKTADLSDPNVPSGYWSMFTKLGANPAECALWISPVVLTLAILALFSKRNRDSEDPTIVPGALLIGLGVLLAFGSPLNQLLFFYFPGWSATGSPGRAHVLIVLGLCILGAIGFDRLIAKNDGSKKWMALALVPLVLLGLGFNVLNLLGGVLAQPGDDSLAKIISLTTKPHLPGIAFSALLSAIVILLIVSKKLPQIALVPTVLLIFTLLDQHPLSGKPLEIPQLNIPFQERAVFVSRNWNMVQTPEANMPPNMASLARVHDLFGYDSILDKAFVEKLKSALGNEPAPNENGNTMFPRLKTGENFSPEVTAALAKLGASKIDRQHPGSMTENVRVVATTDRKSGQEPGAAIGYDGYDHQLLAVKPGTTRILIKDRFYPGMTTPTPNTTIEDEDGWRLIKTDGNQTKIRIDYPGRKNFIGVIIGIALLLVGYVLAIRKHESSPAEA